LKSIGEKGWVLCYGHTYPFLFHVEIWTDEEFRVFPSR
jgi:hypothetical protein